MSKVQVEKEEGARSFARFLETIADGEAHGELCDELVALTKVLETRAAATVADATGTLTLTIKLCVDPEGRADVAYAIKKAEPAPRRPKSVFWVTKGGNLSADNPRQARLPGLDLVRPSRHQEIAIPQQEVKNL